jgi:integrase
LHELEVVAVAKGSVIEYRGKRGTVFRIKYEDANKRQVMETVGAARDGVTEKQARELLADRLSDVRRKGYRRPQPLTFNTYAERWFAEGMLRRAWRPRTVKSYQSGLRHLKAYFGPLRLASIRPRDVADYTRQMQSPDRKPKPFAAKTVQLHLNLLHDVFKTALAEELVDANPVDGAERPKVRRRRWRILQPNEVPRVLKAFEDEQARTMFLTLMLTGVRRFELLALRWRDVSLVESTLRVAESKSEEGERLIALSPTLADALADQYRRTAFKGDDEFVFCHQGRGSRVYEGWYTDRFRTALKAAGITDYIRPFHDARHASLTNGAAAGESPIALMTRAGHRSMQTTKGYLHLAGVVFRDEAHALEQRLFGPVDQGEAAGVESIAELD